MATVVVFLLTYRNFGASLDLHLEKEKSWSSSSSAKNLAFMTGKINNHLEYLADPFTQRVLKRDVGSRDFRSACFDFSVNSSSKQVKCTPSFSVAGMPKSGTSALYFYLKHHPQLALMRKELCALDSPTTAISLPSKKYFDLLLPLESVCKDCLVGEGCIGLGMRDASAYQFAIPSLSTIFLLLRHPAKHLYASYWFWCTREEMSMKIKGCSPGTANWNPRQNITYVDANNMTRWYNFPR